MEVAVENTEINKKRLSFSLYLNYFIHGFGLIILAQNINSLSSAWNTPIKTVSFVISGVGIGRLLAYLITGPLADIFSRKLFVYIGMLSYFVFALGMTVTRSIPVAYVLAILAGIANSALDAGTYTTLVEISDGNGYGTVVVKGFMSIGEFILPLIVVFLANNGLWFGWSFIIMAALLILNMINMATLKFPQVNNSETIRITATSEETGKQKVLKIAKLVILLAYGYISMALMIWFTQWITLFAQNELNFSGFAAHLVMSLYSVGSMLGVIALFIMLKREFNKVKLLVNLNALAMISLAIITLMGKNEILTSLASLVFGFSAAGGIMQVGLTIFMNIYPQRKGLVTGVFYFFGSIASFTVPLITGVLSEKSIAAAFSGDLVIGILAVGLSLVLALIMHTEEKWRS